MPCRGKGGFGTAALQQLIDGGAAVRVMRMDLASLQSVRDFVADFAAAELPPVKGLVCNAGLLQIQAPSITADGFEVCTVHSCSTLFVYRSKIPAVGWKTATSLQSAYTPVRCPVGPCG